MLFMVNFKEDDAYAYTSGRLRALENKLITKNTFKAIYDLSPEQIKATLGEVGFAVEKEISIFQFEEIIEAEEDRVYKFLRRISPQKELIDALFSFDDVLNAKYAVKSAISGNGVDHSLGFRLGIIDINTMILAVSEKKLNLLPDWLAEAVEKAMNVDVNKYGYKQIDKILDEAYLHHLIKTADTIGSEFLRELIKLKIDLSNLTTLVRCKLLNKDEPTLRSLFISGGKIREEKLINIYRESLEHLPDYLHQFRNYLKDVGTWIKSKTGLVRWGKIVDDVIMEAVKTAKTAPPGPDVVVAYTLAKMTELKNLRIVSIGKIENVNKDTVYEMLRETYM